MKSLWDSGAPVLLTVFAVYLRLHAAPGYVESELLVKWQDGPESYAAAIGNAAIGSAVKRNFNAIGWQHVKLPPGTSVRDGIEAYQALGTVLAVEPNGVMAMLPPAGRAVPSAPGEGSDVAPDDGAVGTARPAIRPQGPTPPPPPTPGLIPNDPMFSQQWYLKMIGATNAWATTAGSTNVVVAVLDTGINYNHEDLAPNMWRNPGEIPGNGIDDDGNGFVDDVYGLDTASDRLGNDSDPFDEGFRAGGFWVHHGSLCAGLIGAVGDNGKGIAGVSWSIHLMAIRMTTTNGLDNIADTIAAFEYVVSMKRRGVNIRVTSNSYGTDPRSVYSQALKDAIDVAGNEAILNVFAAANDSLDIDSAPRYPPRYDSPSLIVVAASDQSDDLASFSNYGRTGVDLVAPGVDITSTFGPATNAYASGYRGTSFACPLVAGAAALLLSVNPNLTVDELKGALFGSADQPAGLKGKVATNGRLNVARALGYLTNASPPAILIRALPGGSRTPPNAPVQVTFNRSMNRASIESAFFINPPLSGTFEWSADSRSFFFRHDAPFDSTTNYTVRILGTARDDAGGTFDGNFNGTPEGSPADDFVWTFRFPIPNDDFANAQWLAGPSGSVAGNNRYASVEVDEPSQVVGEYDQFGMSVWYRWTTPEPAGWFTFDLGSGTTFDSLLAVYSGDRLDRKAPIAGNDNYGSRSSSRVSFEALAGTNYSIVVASKSVFDPSQAGNFNLTWFSTPPPAFTGTQFFPAIGEPGARVTLTGTNFTGATGVLFNGARASFTNAATNNIDLGITTIVPPDATSGPITIVTPHGNVTSTASFQVLPPQLTVRFSSANELEIAWPATSGAFVLESSEGLSAGSWTPVGQGPRIENGQSKLMLVAPAGNRFYRLKTQ